MSHPHDQLAAYVDGELDAAEATAFDLHLADCRACQDALHDAMQLAAVEFEVRGAAARSPRAEVLAAPDAARDPLVVAIGDATVRRARRPSPRPMVAAALAAAAAIALGAAIWRLSPAAGPSAPVASPDPGAAAPIAAATAQLERTIAEADAAAEAGGGTDRNARRARARAFSLLVVDAGRAGAWDRAWGLLGRAARLPVPRRCALGVAVEDGASLVVARDAAGADRGALRTGAGPAIDAAHLVPAALVDALRGCPEVEVLARPPAQGLPALLPAELAWSYRLDREPESAAAPLPNAAATAPGRPRRLVVTGAAPPASLGVARLAAWSSADRPDVVLEGPAATPARTLDELGDATFVEIHAHGMVDASTAGAFLMLSPDPDGRYALTAAAIRQRALRGRPIVILAACHAAATASDRLEAWSLPAAFLAAGARTVIASTDAIDDASAGAVFDDLRARIAAGASPAVALRDARAAHLARHPGAAWVRSVMAFR